MIFVDDFHAGVGLDIGAGDRAGDEQRPFREAVESKVEQMGGLADEETAAMLIAHDLSVVRHICDRVAVMYLGHIMEIGDTDELFENPKNPYTYSLLSAIPSTDPTAGRYRARRG